MEATGADHALADQILNGIPLPAFLLDSGESIAAANAPALRLLGPQARGRPLALALRAPDLLGAVAALREGGAPRAFLLRLSDEAQYQVSLSPLPALGPGAALCVLRDTTAEAQNEAIRREFVANVSHELRTPLTALMGFIETLQTAAKDDAGARERFLAIMEREAGRMNRLVRDLLQLSRVEAQERMHPREAVDLVQVIRSAAATLRGQAEEHGGRILTEGLTAGPMVSGDADQLMQVFVNLMENAVKYGAHGQDVTVSLHREVTSRGPVLRIDVADRGEGIDPTHLPRLTERFYRIDSHRSRAGGGTGLGLAIVKHILNRHRGWLKIDSRKGEGSVFSVFLPER